MKTIGWGIVQVPLLSHYRVCFCLKRNLVESVGGTGWKLFIQSALRLLLLSMWGMTKIDYSLPQTDEKIVGIYIELAILSLQIVDGLAAILSSWFENLYLLYPSLVVIPVCFLVDFLIKATCYGQLFLWPQVTAFGVFSLVEFWLRYLGLIYCWLALISFVYSSRGKKNPFEREAKDSAGNPTSRASSLKSPFSRSSTLSKRGRHSFLLRSRPSATNDVVIADDGRSTLLQDSYTSSEVSSEQLQTSTPQKSNLANPGSRDRNSSRGSKTTTAKSVSIDERSLRRPSETAVPATRIKRTGGFVPPLLREQTVEDDEHLKEKSEKSAPVLPSQPPVGNLYKSSKKGKKDSSVLDKKNDLNRYKTQQSFMV
uniref:Uncharacterized protein n=1 Tax=Ciona savignyi TaxID=51511 RepID=H2Z185_CIOSA